MEEQSHCFEVHLRKMIHSISDTEHPGRLLMIWDFLERQAATLLYNNLTLTGRMSEIVALQ